MCTGPAGIHHKLAFLFMNGLASSECGFNMVAILLRVLTQCFWRGAAMSRCAVAAIAKNRTADLRVPELTLQKITNGRCTDLLNEEESGQWLIAFRARLTTGGLRSLMTCLFLCLRFITVQRKMLKITPHECTGTS